MACVPRDRLMDNLVAARMCTLSWVEELDESALDQVGRHPALGKITVETFINALYGHQLLHIHDLKRALE